MQIKLKDIAKMTGFSVSVVSRALSTDKKQAANVSLKTRVLIQKVVKETGYNPNHSASFLKRGRAASIGVFLPHNRTSLIIDLFNGISKIASDNNIPLNFYFGLSRQDYIDFLNKMDKISSAGIITYWPFEINAQQVLFERLQSFLDNGGQAILLHTVPANAPDIPSVTVDNYMGGYQAGKHLASLNCDNNISIFWRNFIYRTERSQGFDKAMREAGKQYIEIDEALPFVPSENRKLIEKISKHIEENKTLGLFIDSDPLAIIIANHLKQIGFEIGKQIKLIGFDGIEACTYCVPQLSTIRQPFYEMGEMVMQKLINMLRGHREESQILPTELVVRGSTSL